MAGISEYLEILLAGSDLTFEQARGLLDEIFAGEVLEPQVAAFLTAMRVKGEKPQEIAGLASSLREHAVSVKADIGNMIDTCGTGGAVIKTFNISTASALAAAGAGVYVAKHGNRAITSKCGSADVLVELGVKIDLGPDKVAECLEEAHIGFMFAPMFHPAMKYVQPIRKALGFRTVFNILGPLANPAGVTSQVMGVASADLIEKIAETLKLLGTKRAMVVHGGGLDEISTVGKTDIYRIVDGQVEKTELDPESLGIKLADIEELKSGDAAYNASIVRGILDGSETGAKKDIVLLNAAAGIMTAALADDFESALKMADESITSDSAMGCLEKMIEVSNS